MMNELITKQAVLDIVDDLRDRMTVEGYCAMVERVEALKEAKESDLISRKAAIDCVTVGAKPTTIRGRIAELPSAQPERKTGRWEWSEDNASWCCSVCGCVFEEIDWKPEYNYCPNCGVRMNGGDEGGET